SRSNGFRWISSTSAVCVSGAFTRLSMNGFDERRTAKNRSSSSPFRSAFDSDAVGSVIRRSSRSGGEGPRLDGVANRVVAHLLFNALGGPGALVNREQRPALD